jgi:hypothetical protein
MFRASPKTCVYSNIDYNAIGAISDEIRQLYKS